MTPTPRFLRCRRHASMLGLAAAVASIIALASNASHAAEAMVRIDNFTFTPATLSVPAGTTVEWRNEDDIPHTVTDKKLAFKSKPLDTDDGFAHTFTTPGRYEYFCSLHPHMVGTIIVEPSAPRS